TSYRGCEYEGKSRNYRGSENDPREQACKEESDHDTATEPKHCGHNWRSSAEEHRGGPRGPGFRNNLGTKDGPDEWSIFRAYAGAARHRGCGKHQQAGYSG